jgi:hypothetical protein
MALRIVLLLFSCATPALAGQTVSTTAGAITGTVTDTTGSVLRGATVSMSSDALMVRQTAVTDHHGRYRFPVVPPGEYVLIFTLQGFKTLNRPNIYVGLGFTATVNAQLDLAASSQDVMVEGRTPLVDARSTAATTRFDLRELADLPSARSMWALLAATPAVQVGRFDVGGNTSVTGIPFTVYGTASPNRPMVEGISVAGITPTGFTLDYGSFSEVSIGTAAHSADWPMPGVLMQFLVKSGGNKYHGSLYADYGDNDWQSFNIDATQVRRRAAGGGLLSPRETNRLWRYYDINGDVGGYIVRDMLWWYFSLRDQEVSARFVNFPVFPHRTHLTNYSAKTTYQVTPRQKFIVFAQVGRNHQPTRLDPFGPVGGGLAATTVIN